MDAEHETRLPECFTVILPVDQSRNTGLPPDSVLTGFLPPEDGTGHPAWAMSATSSSPRAQPGNRHKEDHGTSPLITFDSQRTRLPPIRSNDEDPSQGTDPTKEGGLTIDAGSPTSSVTATPATETNTTFTVAWSGIRRFRRFRRCLLQHLRLGQWRAFTPFLTGTTQTSATFTGLNGHTYGFYSIATDNVGNVEPTPISAQATTQVDVPSDTTPPTSSVTAAPSRSNLTFAVSWSGQDNAGGSGLASFSIFVLTTAARARFLTGTTQTSAPFTGVNGHNYGFYSIAVDLASNVEATPKSAATTRVAVNTDTTPPTSSVTALPAFSTPSFTVTWSGQDNPGGSGITAYTIFVSDDGRACSRSGLAATTQASDVYPGVAGHTYGFYSVATDVAGNVQTTSAAQAIPQTLLDTNQSNISTRFTRICWAGRRMLPD